MNINLTLLGQMITFALLVWVTMKYVWPPIIKAMQERQKQIADGLAAAERGKHEQQLAEERAKKVLQEAKQQAADIVAMAQKRANEIVESSKDTARQEGDRIKAAAQSEIEQEVTRAREELRKQVGTLAISGAERILKKEIDAKAHNQVIKDLVSQI
ncbi:F0F1 ATP synthase subunit B [Ectothiorhodospira lacustris]|uniref:F0F1 ATP synthase subunit B n=1 Tax=Ectothiorhodospira lacustris TaxID=2899127 RepID=UPI001EE7B7A5|nr:F0F1 ATP synthase subunit B [Ectothiorhodospira lacustris]MCG5509707.1 F0F1 ATP synthase subunit B [Ectothiorhodospira lacustris]MCG5523060.1 F0F1 ATP synthase subunit B [Ectothiorhodospira lacustris]